MRTKPFRIKEAYIMPPKSMLFTMNYHVAILIVYNIPTIMKPSSTEAGPPVWKALPEPTNRPAPIAPPLYARVSIQMTIQCAELAWQSSACVCLSGLDEVCSRSLRPYFLGHY
jgi:hypothetical protein